MEDLPGLVPPVDAAGHRGGGRFLNVAQPSVAVLAYALDYFQAQNPDRRVWFEEASRAAAEIAREEREAALEAGEFGGR